MQEVCLDWSQVPQEEYITANHYISKMSLNIEEGSVWAVFLGTDRLDTLLSS